MDMLHPLINPRSRRSCGRGAGNEKSGLLLLFDGFNVLAISSGAVWSYGSHIEC